MCSLKRTLSFKRIFRYTANIILRSKVRMVKLASTCYETTFEQSPSALERNPALVYLPASRRIASSSFCVSE